MSQPTGKKPRFTLLERIGAGGMGAVYAAYDERLDRKVAIKLVRTERANSARAEERLLREARTLARLSHPNVVQVYEVGVFEGRLFIAMEFIRGKTLGALLAEEDDRPAGERQQTILRHFIAAGRGLQAAHDAGLIHRDFKPANVLIGDDGRVRVVDFGLARGGDGTDAEAEAEFDADFDADAETESDSESESESESESDSESDSDSDSDSESDSDSDSDSDADSSSLAYRGHVPLLSGTTIDFATGSVDRVVLTPGVLLPGEPLDGRESRVGSSEDAPVADTGSTVVLGHEMATASTELMAATPRSGIATKSHDTRDPRPARSNKLVSGMAIGMTSAVLPAAEWNAALTTVGTLLGTPLYMAPEQIRAVTSDARSDQFSFCVALYEGLYGQRPFVADTLGGLAESIESGEIQSPPRGGDVPSVIRRALWRGLSADPERRFPDMAALLAVLDRGAQKRRTWRMVLASVALAAAFGATALLASDDQAGPCAAAGDEIAALWSPERKARVRAAFDAVGVVGSDAAWTRAEAIIDRYVAAWRGDAIDACEATHVRQIQSSELLDRRITCLERGKNQLAALVAGLAEADAEAVARSADAAANLADVAVCRDTDTLLMGPEPPADASTAAAVAEIRRELDRARTVTALGRPEQALTIATIQDAAASDVAYPLVRAEVMHRLASSLLYDKNPDTMKQAEELLVRASKIAESARHDRLALKTWLVLAAMYSQDSSRADDMDGWLERADVAAHRLGDPSIERAKILRQKALHHLARARYREAIELLERAVQSTRELHNDNQTLWYLHELARAERLAGRTADAARHFERALTQAETHLGVAHPETSRLRIDFALLLDETGDSDRARRLLHGALDSSISLHGPEHRAAGRIHRTLGDLERKAGNLALAQEHITTAVAIYSELFEPDARQRADVIAQLAVLAYERGEYATALDSYRDVLRIRQRHRGPEHPYVGITHLNIAEALVALERHDEALAALATGRRILEKSQLNVPALPPWMLSVEGQALLGQRRLAGSIARLEESVRLFASIDSYPGERASASWALARALRQRDGWPNPRARGLAEDALALHRSRGPAGETASRKITRWLGNEGATSQP